MGEKNASRTLEPDAVSNRGPGAEGGPPEERLLRKQTIKKKMQVAEERGFVLPNLHTQQIDKPRSQESAETRSGRRRRLGRICGAVGL